ncbi:MAG: Lacal_2735 family protein [Bacteroidota bacterium]
MGLFKKKSQKEKLQAKYKKLMEESYKLSHSNRQASDDKAAEADAVLKEMEALPD